MLIPLLQLRSGGLQLVLLILLVQLFQIGVLRRFLRQFLCGGYGCKVIAVRGLVVDEVQQVVDEQPHAAQQHNQENDNADQNLFSGRHPAFAVLVILVLILIFLVVLIIVLVVIVFLVVRIVILVVFVFLVVLVISVICVVAILGLVVVVVFLLLLVQVFLLDLLPGGVIAFPAGFVLGGRNSLFGFMFWFFRAVAKQLHIIIPTSVDLSRIFTRCIL